MSVFLRDLLRRLSWAVYVGFVVLAVLPFILLTSSPPWIFAVLLGFASLAMLLLRSRARPEPRPHAATSAALLAAAAAGLLIIEGTGILRPFVEPEGDLILAVVSESVPMEVVRGGTITYRLTVDNDQRERALRRKFQVDGQDCRGVLMYLELPRDESGPLPVIQVRSWVDGAEVAASVIYADPGPTPLLPIFWDWRSSLSPEHRMVGVITRDGDLPPGASLHLELAIRVPETYAKAKVRAGHTGLGYIDPQVGAFVAQDLWSAAPPVVNVVD